MKTKNLQKKLYEHRKTPCLAAFALVVALGTSAASTSWADALYFLTGVEDTAIVLDGSQEIPDLSDRMVQVSSGKNGYDIHLDAGLAVQIERDGATVAAVSEKETISALLSRMNIVLSPLEMVAVDLKDSGTLRLTISEEATCYEKISEPASFETVRVANPKLAKGKERVVQEGANGVRTSIYEVVWSGGQLLSRQFVEELSSTAVDKVIEYGTATPAPTAAPAKSDKLVDVRKNADGSGTLVFASGATASFSSAKSMTATAYTGGYNGVGYTTASGTHVRKGVVAVDRKVIPLGSKLYIVTNDGIVYGMATAEDTGVRGNAIDLYHDTYRQCIEFGRRGCTVYVLK